MKKLIITILLLTSSLAFSQPNRKPLAFDAISFALNGNKGSTTKQLTITSFPSGTDYVVLIYVISGKVTVSPTGRCGGGDIITQGNSALCLLSSSASFTSKLTLTPTGDQLVANGTYQIADKTA